MITKKRVLACILAIFLVFAACVVVDDVTVELNTYEYYDSDLPMLFTAIGSCAFPIFTIPSTRARFPRR